MLWFQYQLKKFAFILYYLLFIIYNLYSWEVY